MLKFQSEKEMQAFLSRVKVNNREKMEEQIADQLAALKESAEETNSKLDTTNIKLTQAELRDITAVSTPEVSSALAENPAEQDNTEAIENLTDALGDFKESFEKMEKDRLNELSSAAVDRSSAKFGQSGTQGIAQRMKNLGYGMFGGERFASYMAKRSLAMGVEKELNPDADAKDIRKKIKLIDIKSRELNKIETRLAEYRKIGLAEEDIEKTGAHKRKLELTKEIAGQGTAAFSQFNKKTDKTNNSVFEDVATRSQSVSGSSVSGSSKEADLEEDFHQNKLLVEQEKQTGILQDQLDLMIGDKKEDDEWQKRLLATTENLRGAMGRTSIIPGLGALPIALAGAYGVKKLVEGLLDNQLEKDKKAEVQSSLKNVDETNKRLMENGSAPLVKDYTTGAGWRQESEDGQRLLAEAGVSNWAEYEAKMNPEPFSPVQHTSTVGGFNVLNSQSLTESSTVDTNTNTPTTLGVEPPSPAMKEMKDDLKAAAIRDHTTFNDVETSTIPSLQSPHVSTETPVTSSDTAIEKVAETIGKNITITVPPAPPSKTQVAPSPFSQKIHNPESSFGAYMKSCF